jgi:Tfp pilus assembly protein PilV
MRPDRQRIRAFALYEVMIGVTIFVVGILSLGRSVENCMSAVTLSAQEDRVRQILANRMAEVQATPGFPDAKWEANVETGYGAVKLIQASGPCRLEGREGPRDWRDQPRHPDCGMEPSRRGSIAPH